MWKRMCDFFTTITVAGILYSGCLVQADAQNVQCATRALGDNTNACASTAFVHNELAGNIPLPNGYIFVGNASNVAVGVLPSGDWTVTNAGVNTVAKVNGVAYPASPSTNTIPVVTGANTITYETAPVAAGGTGATTFSANLPLIGNGTGAVAQGTRSGNTTSFATTSGVLTSGNCMKFDASGNIIDAGGTCATGIVRNRLTATLNMYLATTGTDTGDCTNIAAPCLTRQYAYNYVQQYIDMGKQIVLVNMAAGSYTDAFTANGPLTGDCGNCFNFFGVNGNASAVTINDSTAGHWTFNLQRGARIVLQYMTVSGTATSGGAVNISQGTLEVYNVNFGAATTRHIEVAGGGSWFIQQAAIGITGDAPYFIVAESGGNVSLTGTVTATGTRTFSSAFIDANAGSAVETSGLSCSGTFVGSRYEISTGAYINAASTTALCGNAVGTVNGGYYVVSTPSSATTGTGIPVNQNSPNLWLPAFGVSGGSNGNFYLNGSTSGTISLIPQAAAGTYNWNWPTTAGTAGQCLVSQGGGGTAMTWGACSGGASGITIGTSTITSGTTTRVLYDNAGVVGEYTISGSGNVAMTTSPSFTTPTLGVASATTINKVTFTAPATGSTLTIDDGITLRASTTSIIKPPTRTVKTTGSGTYTTPSGATWLDVRGCGGGGGGAGSGTTVTAGTTGGNTTFSTLTGNGGTGGPINAGTPASGGTATGGDINISGGQGTIPGGGAPSAGGPGGATVYGGAGAGVNSGASAQPGGAAAANSCAGGGAASGSSTANAGAGGGAGGYFSKIITSPSATYSYGVGAGGGGGGAGTNGAAGGAGANGIIDIMEHYNFLLRRDLNPAANDNSPMFLNEVA